MVDTTPPNMTALAFPGSVNIAAGPKDITFTMSALDDASGIHSASIRFNNDLVDGLSFVALYGTVDSWADGTSTATGTVRANTPLGTYTIVEVVVYDNTINFNKTTYTTAQLAALGFATQITVTDVDNVAPQLTSLTFPTDVDVSAGNTPITFSAAATDDATGVRELVINFDKSLLTGPDSPGQVIITDTIADPWADGASAVTATLPQTLPSGIYSITDVRVTDDAGNVRIYTAAQLQALGIATSINITGAAPPDTAPPELTSLEVPTAVDVRPGTGPVAFDARATDATGVDDLTIWLDRNITLSTGVAGGFLLDGGADSWSDGQSAGAWLVSSAAAPGVYEIDHVDIRDTLGNSVTYSASQLAVLGIRTGFFVLNASIDVAANAVIGGTVGNDNLVGTSVNNVLFGMDGNDTLTCGGGSDWMYGGVGDDTYQIISSTDRIFEDANSGADRALTGVSYTLSSGQAVEILATLNVSLTISINLTGNELANGIIGNAGANILNGGGGADSLRGMGGSDTYFVDRAADLVTEAVGAGADRVLASASYALQANSEIEILKTTNDAGVGAINLTGNAFANQIYGNAGANICDGKAGNDTLDGGAGADVLIGGLGDDVYFVDNAADAITEAIGEGANDRLFASVSYVLAAGRQIEDIRTVNAAAIAAINLIGNEFNCVMQGNAGANMLNGGGGIDVMFGFGGNDIYTVDNASDRAIEAVGGGVDRVTTSVSFVLEAGREVENLTTANSAAATSINLAGNAFSNTIQGNAGANALNGGGGVDTMFGFAGNDFYYVDNAGDRTIEAAGGGADRVLTSVSFALEAGREIEQLTTTGAGGTTALNLTGNAFNNVITGNAGANTLNGGGGIDTMFGLAGNDFYHVDNASDRAIEAAAGGADRVFASVSFVLEAGREIEQLTTANAGLTAALNLTGNAFANTIVGNAGNNFINGGGGGDTLFGLGGLDNFMFTTALGASNVDAISGFVVTDDTIRVDNAVFGGLPATGVLASDAFHIGTAAADAEDRIIYNSGTGALLHDADGVGGAAAIQFATVSAGLLMTNTDFVVV